MRKLNGWLFILVAALTGACTSLPQIPEGTGEPFQVPYFGPMRLTYWGALKADPNVFAVTVEDKLFYIYGEAVRPSIQSAYLLENTVIAPGEVVLDLGTGSGIQAIFAARTASHVVATDIGADAIKSAQYNVEHYGLGNKIDIRLGDLFAPIRADEKFDVIINNIEYPEDDLNSPLWEVHRRLFAQVRNFLKPNGRILYQSGSIKNMPLVEKMALENGLSVVEAHVRQQLVHGKTLVFYVIRPSLYPAATPRRE